MEEWRTISGFEGYEASSLGRIRRRTRAQGTKPGRIKIPQLQTDGYLGVNLYINSGRPCRHTVHHLVCRAFHGPPPPGCDQVRHFPDRSKTNNKPENLFWTNAKGNAQDRIAHGTHPCGSKNGFSKLNEETVARIKAALADGVARKMLAKKYNVSVDTINLIARQKTWKHVNAPTP